MPQLFILIWYTALRTTINAKLRYSVVSARCRHRHRRRNAVPCRVVRVYRIVAECVDDTQHRAHN